MSNLVKYQQYTPEDASEDAASLDASGFWKSKEGKNRVRFLPARPGNKPIKKVWQHFIEKVGESSVIFPCPRVHGKTRCVACDHADELRKTGNPKDRDIAYKMSAKLRFFGVIVDRANPDKGPQVIGMGKTIFEPLVALHKDPDLGGDWSDPGPMGYDVFIMRKGKGKNDTEYTVTPARDRSPLGNDGWIESQPDISSLDAPRDPDFILKALGLEPDEPGAPAAARTVSTTASKPAPGSGRTAADDLADNTDFP